jgi:NitT/TauT family transport system substrate-binding protein
MRGRIWGVTLAAGLALAGGQAWGQAKTDVKFVLDWAFQGPQSMFLLAEDKGHYAAANVAVKIDRGFGSADAVNKVASGAYDMGFADINSLIEFNAKNPDKALIAVMVGYDTPPLAIVTLKKTGIAKPADLEGKTLAAPVFDAAYRLFPLFTAAAKIDGTKAKWLNVKPELREPMLIKGEADAISGFYFTALLNLKAAKVAESDIVAFQYADFGVDVYGNAVIVAPAFAEKHPDAVKGFVAAVIKGAKDTLKDPKSAIAAVKKRDALIDEAVELERLQLAIARNILTENVKKDGLGGVQPARLAKNIELIAEVFKLPAKPAPDKVFTDKFLPPAAERKVN